MEKRFIALSVFAVAVVAALFFLFAQPLQSGKAKDLPIVNIRDYSYKVSVERPEVFLQEQPIEQSDQKQGTEVTVYNQDLALVKEFRNIFLKNGLNLVEYKDIAREIEPTSVLFSDIDNPETVILEQNYEFDIVSRSKILEKYLDKQITVLVNEGQGTSEVSGKLLSASDGILIDTGSGIVSVTDVSKISFPSLPDGLITKPTLVWKVWAQKEGNRNTKTSYLTKGMTWRADYIAKVSADDKEMDFSGWTTVTNNSGTSYPDAQLKLVAGDIHLVLPPIYYPERSYAYDGATGAPAPKSFSEEGLFEYHLYTLERKTDLADNQTKQISLLSAEKIPVKKEFFYDGAMQGEKVQVKLKFKNSKEQGIGLPLPKGIVRVYKEDSSEQMQFLGEDLIDHTKTEDEVRLFVGNAFDVSGERTQTEAVNVSKGMYRYTYEIKIQNQKDQEIEVVVAENIGQYSKVTKNSGPFDQKSASEIEFVVKVPAKGEKTVSYSFESRYFY